MSNSGIRILVVDDETFMHKLLAHMLVKLGYTAVSACESGALVLDIVDGPKPPELILLALNMPDMDGIELVRKLVDHGYTGSVILVSGAEERVLQTAVYLVQAHHITVLGHLRKPVSIADLEEMTGRWRPADEAEREATSYTAHDVRWAIDNGELVNYYQPKVNVATGAVSGVETLVRWQHQEDGLVFPDRFISLAEETGLIDDLTRVVLSSAMKQTREWNDAGLRLKVAVNLSMSSCSSVTFADFVTDVIALEGVEPEDVVLEVTESRLMLDQRAPLEILTRLRLKHFRLSIDDFGTGNSSLTQLLKIPFDELKIDRSFVHGATHDSTALAMYSASLNLGRELGMEVVAEGVEDLEDWDLLRRTHCDVAQGYFIARPMPAEDLIGWITQWEERLPQLLT
ncbi:EAL domain-containing response regulator [Cryobacterium sp. CG_9.6]|uniref:EAL domain-containing response regulator n=1 Tax=Cryobacterium sp. CG_9.6 TaxID=2760710 RepID=UPI002475D750|nr:EAL domain-containing response regulator [Cryobacterium sp. CG_9.6]MDH6237550.1 EAL domain-containing protein (putative c-di-GMP-specific phosphodiesterase class I)/FixJ family two-component response regulator [Cryobacterium sp. CG_9.6]